MNNQTLNPLPFFDSPNRQEDLLSEKMLATERNFIIKMFKDPLRKAIIALAKRLIDKVGEPTKENSVFAVTHLLIDKKELFFSKHHNPGRDPMMEAGWNILISEVEHDPYYRFIFYWFISEMVKEYENGNLSLEAIVPEVIKPCWEVKNG